MSTNQAYTEEFITCTIPLNVTGNGYGHPMLVRIDLHLQSDDSVLLTSRGGNTNQKRKMRQCSTRRMGQLSILPHWRPGLGKVGFFQNWLGPS
ncbi:hypothetical protein ALO53_200162 [Pseudomonas amygdali pv. photiniae]|uniref:Uncharacterized protein n=1 Tax=Pseudomonas amygdali pv. photiniae TaxID=251724 RepID=A0A0P9TC03_PSEA0|nr:hypothetical protein ALO53_200162 [Pseudomonas amygdali pv. photiniae]